jgi:hypothetical protein
MVRKGQPKVSSDVIEEESSPAGQPRAEVQPAASQRSQNEPWVFCANWQKTWETSLGRVATNGHRSPGSLREVKSSSLTHARRMDGFCNQNADKLGSLAGPSLLTASSRAISEHLDFISGHLGAPRSQAWLREQGDWNGSRATSEGWVLLEGRACKIARAERNSTHSRHTSKGR